MSSNVEKQEFTLEYRRETIVDQIVKILEQRILSGELSPGAKLSELMVSKQFDISRIPAREALQRLEEMNLVKKTHLGRVVAAFSLEEFRDIYELKIGIESFGIVLGSARATETELEEIEAVITQMEDARDNKDYDNLKYINYQFHDLMVGCSKNKKIIDTFSMLAKQVRWATSLSLHLPHRPVTVVKEHLAIFSAFKDRNEKKVRELIETHLENNLDRVIARAQSKGGGRPLILPNHKL